MKRTLLILGLLGGGFAGLAAGALEALDAAEFSRIVPSDARVQKLAGDMKFLEGPLWMPAQGGFLIFSDGIRCDKAGRLYASAGDGVHIFAPDGRMIGRIQVPETPSNLCFGGQDNRTLFITARTSLYSIPLSVAGLR